MARKAARTRKVLKKDVVYCECHVVGEVVSSRDTGWLVKRSMEPTSWCVLCSPQPHAYCFKWEKMFVNQCLAEEISPCPCNGVAPFLGRGGCWSYLHSLLPPFQKLSHVYSAVGRTESSIN